MELRTPPHPTIIKKMRTFLEVKGKLGPIPQPQATNTDPLSQTLIPMLEILIKLQKREEE